MRDKKINFPINFPPRKEKSFRLDSADYRRAHEAQYFHVHTSINGQSWNIFFGLRSGIRCLCQMKYFWANNFNTISSLQDHISDIPIAFVFPLLLSKWRTQDSKSDQLFQHTPQPVVGDTVFHNGVLKSVHTEILEDCIPNNRRQDCTAYGNSACPPGDRVMCDPD